MEVPDAVKGLTIEKYEFVNALLQDNSKGIIVGEIAFLDHLLAEVLSAFSRSSGGTAGFSEKKVEKMTFSDKIDRLQGVSLTGQPATTRDAVVASLTPMRKLRNVAAHEPALTPAKVEELYADADNRKLLSGFPANFKATAAETQRLLHELQKLPEFAPPP